MSLPLVNEFDADRLHGYNAQYRNANAGRFYAFDLEHGRPGQFLNQPVEGFPAWLDHQGHIIPQNNYTPRLLQIARAVDNALQPNPQNYTLQAVNQHLMQNFGNLNFQHVTAYIQQHLIAGHAPRETIFVNPFGGDLEDRIGGYFSVVNWNPVNICRAPSDHHRHNFPLHAADLPVAQALINHPNDPGITVPAAYRNFLVNNINNLLGNVDQFIAACNDCLQNSPIGYYQFRWGALPDL